MAQLITCPECKKHLQVPDELLGKKVQCPECKHTFVAAAEPVETVNTGTTASKPAPMPSTAPPSKTAEWDRETSSATGKTQKKDDDDAYDVSKKKRRRDRDDDDDDDDDDDEERRRRKRRRREEEMTRPRYQPHRGEMILIFGILSLLPVMLFPFIFGPIAFFMGSSDLKAMREGRMDPAGEGTTNTGRILGMVGMGLYGLLVLGCCGFYIFVFSMALAAGGPGPPQPQRRF